MIKPIQARNRELAVSFPALRLGVASPWHGHHPDSRRWKEGMGLLTVVKCYGVLWSANPCRLVYAHWDRKLPRELVGVSL